MKRSRWSKCRRRETSLAQWFARPLNRCQRHTFRRPFKCLLQRWLATEVSPTHPSLSPRSLRSCAVRSGMYRLQELKAAAMTASDEYLFACGDEQLTVYDLNDNFALVRKFEPFGRPIALVWFEGVLIVADTEAPFLRTIDFRSAVPAQNWTVGAVRGLTPDACIRPTDVTALSDASRPGHGLVFVLDDQRRDVQAFRAEVTDDGAVRFGACVLVVPIRGQPHGGLHSLCVVPMPVRPLDESKTVPTITAGVRSESVSSAASPLPSAVLVIAPYMHSAPLQLTHVNIVWAGVASDLRLTHTSERGLGFGVAALVTSRGRIYACPHSSYMAHAGSVVVMDADGAVIGSRPFRPAQVTGVMAERAGSCALVDGQWLVIRDTEDRVGGGMFAVSILPANCPITKSDRPINKADGPINKADGPVF